MAFVSGESNALLGALKSADMNVTTDQAIPIVSPGSGRYVPRRIVVANASANLTLAAGGIYTAVAKGGTAVVAAAQVYTALTGSTKYLDATLASLTDFLTATTLYLSLTTAQGAAATADVYVYGDPLP